MAIFQSYATAQNSNIVSSLLEKLGATDINKQFLMLAGIAVAVVLMAFVIAVVISFFSKTKKLTKRVEDVEAYIQNVGGTIDEEQVEGLYSYMQDLPQPVVDGWGNFLQQKIGYPSDYINDGSVMADAAFSAKRTMGSMVFSVFSVIIIAVFAYLGSVVSPSITDEMLSAEGIFINSLFDIISVIVFPIIAYVVGLILISVIYRSQVKKLNRVYSRMKDTLDSSVVLFAEELEEAESTEEYTPGKTEQLDVLDEEIEKIIASKIEQNELIEIVTTPRIAEREEAVAAAMPNPTVERRAALDLSDIELDESEVDMIKLPSAETIFNDDLDNKDYARFIVPDIKAEEPAAEGILPSTPETASRLEELVGIVKNAIADMDGTTKEDLKELANTIKNAKADEAFQNPKDQAVLDECLYELMDLIYPTESL